MVAAVLPWPLCRSKRLVKRKARHSYRIAASVNFFVDVLAKFKRLNFPTENLLLELTCLPCVAKRESSRAIPGTQPLPKRLNIWAKR
jgi:hypothetical protein